MMSQGIQPFSTWYKMSWLDQFLILDFCVLLTQVMAKNLFCEVTLTLTFHNRTENCFQFLCESKWALVPVVMKFPPGLPDISRCVICKIGTDARSQWPWRLTTNSSSSPSDHFRQIWESSLKAFLRQSIHKYVTQLWIRLMQMQSKITLTWKERPKKRVWDINTRQRAYRC